MCISPEYAGYWFKKRVRALRSTSIAVAVIIGMAGGTAGCSTLVTAVAGSALQAVVLQAVGLKGDTPPPSKTVTLRIHAGSNLNANDEGLAYSVVARIYKLREVAPFMSTSYSTFGNAGREREALGDSLLEVREMVLTPGQHLESGERLSGDAAFIGVVMLFRNPAAERWRVAFAKADMDKGGVTIGVHRCAMTVTSGKVYGMDASQLALLTPSTCVAEQGQSRTASN